MNDQQIIAHWIRSGLALGELLGDYAVGMVALEAYFSANPEISADYVAERLGCLSSDTTLRRLRVMCRSEIATRRKLGRTFLFRLKPEIAANALALIRGRKTRST